MKVEIYSRADCQFCTLAKNLLRSKNQPFTEYAIGTDGVNKETIQKRVGTSPDIKTIPQIFIDDVHLGGYTELKAYYAKQT
jgi:glutaredoxin